MLDILFRIGYLGIITFQDLLQPQGNVFIKHHLFFVIIDFIDFAIFK